MGMEANVARTGIAARIDAIGWGLLFVMTGALALIPGLPDGSWLAGFGVLLLGLNGVRFAVGVQVDSFTAIVGLVALVIGLATIASLNLPWVALALIAFGLVIVGWQLVRGG